MKRALFALALALSAPSAAWADQASAVAAVRQQPRVIDVSTDSQGNMFVLVKAENIAWNQFAAYLCKVVAPHRGRIFNIRIIELTKAIRTQPPAKWDRLGNAACAE